MENQHYKIIVKQRVDRVNSGNYVGGLIFGEFPNEEAAKGFIEALARDLKDYFNDDFPTKGNA